MNLHFNDIAVAQVTEQKHLGVILSDDMKWSKHINYVCSKAFKKIGLLFRNSMFFTVWQMARYYISAIRPIVEYASVVFDNCSNCDTALLEKVQRRAANVCTGAMKRTETVKVLQELGWETLKSRRTKAKLILLYKIKNGLVSSSYLSNLIPSEEVFVRQYNFRSVVPSIPNVYSRLKTRESSYFPATIKLWNKLPDVIKTSNSVAVFKKKLVVHFNSLPCQDVTFKFLFI